MNLSKIISTITISFFLLFFNNVMGQYEIDQQGTVNNCSANFHDSDSTGNYLDNETYIMTICTDGSGNSLNIGFGTMFDIDPSDTLYVYEGATTASPLIGAYNNNNILAGVATPTSGDGCLTFKFVSDGAVNGQGWIAIVNCLTICQPVDAIITTTPSTVNYGPDSNYTNICVGDTVQFSVTGNYPDATANSGSYAQSDANTTFDWEFGNGSVDVGTNVNSTYMNEQGYLVILTVTDVNGCIETVRHKIRTGITPEFAGVFASPDISYFEDSVSLIGGFTQTIGQNSTVTVDTGYVSAGGIVSGQTYLPDGNGPAHTQNIQADNNTADAFHTYGFDWTPEYIKVYIDGVLKSEIQKTVITNNGADPDRWVTDVPYWLWFDSETFCWLGIPEEADLPVDYEIEYIRVWEKKNLIDSKFFAFEGSINIDGSDEDWYIPGTASSFMTISDEKPYRWTNSLKFSHSGALPNNAVAFAPFGSTILSSGNYELSLKVWLEPGSTLTNFQVILENPFQTLNFDVSGTETGKWVELSQNFNRTNASGSNDRLRIKISPSDASSGSSTMYFDDIFINENNTLGLEQTHDNGASIIYPNPIDTSKDQKINISSKNAKQIILYNLSGQQLLKTEKNTEPFGLSLTGLPQGIYFMSLISDDIVETKKILVN